MSAEFPITTEALLEMIHRHDMTVGDLVDALGVYPREFSVVMNVFGHKDAVRSVGATTGRELNRSKEVAASTVMISFENSK